MMMADKLNLKTDVWPGCTLHFRGGTSAPVSEIVCANEDTVMISIRLRKANSPNNGSSFMEWFIGGNYRLYREHPYDIVKVTFPFSRLK